MFARFHLGKLSASNLFTPAAQNRKQLGGRLHKLISNFRHRKKHRCTIPDCVRKYFIRCRLINLWNNYVAASVSRVFAQLRVVYGIIAHSSPTSLLPSNSFSLPDAREGLVAELFLTCNKENLMRRNQTACSESVKLSWRVFLSAKY